MANAWAAPDADSIRPCASPATFTPDAAAHADLVRQRQSTRAFTRQPLPVGLLEALLQAARRAPSGANPQHDRFYADPDAAVHRTTTAREPLAIYFSVRD